MTDAGSFTAAQAADPQTPGETLADIAALRPDLRPVVASNPGAYPGLVDWLRSLGEPAVDAALAARERHTPPLPAAPPSAPGFATPGYGAPSAYGSPYAPDGAGYAYPPQTGASPYASYADGSAPTYPSASGASAYGAPDAAESAYSAPGQWGGHGAGGYGGGGPGGGPGPQGPRKSNGTAMVALGVIGVLVVAAVVGVAVWLVAGKTGASDPALSALHDACKDEDWNACDDLFEQAEKGTDDRDFGDTCGGRRDSGASTLCVVAFAPEPTVDPTSTSDPEPEEDVGLLHDKCAAGDLPSCDDLYYTADWDSDDESFGDTCGETMPEGSGGYCETLADSPYTHGDDPDLDALWDACAAGDGAKCDDLFYDAVTTTDYEDFGDTCGSTQPEYSGGMCGLLTGGYTSDAPPTYGADAQLDALWDACAAEDWESCDELYWDFDAPRGSGYWVFGATCGNRGVIDPGACEYEMD